MIYDITLNDPTDDARPPEHVLHIAVVAELVFVSICDYEDTHDTHTVKAVSQITVSLPALRDALALMSEDKDRENLRGKDERGTFDPSISGVRHTVVRL